MDLRNILFKAPVQKHLDALKDAFEEQEREIRDLRERQRAWSEKEEIKKAGEKAEYYRKHSLHELSSKEFERYFAFRDRHFQNCRNPGHYIVELSATGLGEGITVKCPFCGEEEDITDF